jgi:hypothetical protein
MNLAGSKFEDVFGDSKINNQSDYEDAVKEYVKFLQNEDSTLTTEEAEQIAN